MNALSVPPFGFTLAGVLATSPWFSTLALQRDGALYIGKRANPTVPDAAAALADEVRVLQCLSGRAAPAFVTGGTDEYGPYLVMQRAIEEPLSHRLGHVDSRHHESFVKAAFQALDCVHSTCHEDGILDVVHGDIHPGNVLASDDGSRVLFIDFGLVRFRGTARIPSGAFRGSAMYASPEAARGEELDQTSDRYSLALSLLHTLSGVPPRQSEPLPSMLLHAAEDSLDDYIARAAVHVPPSMTHILVQCIAFDRRHRPSPRERLF